MEWLGKTIGCLLKKKFFNDTFQILFLKHLFTLEQDDMRVTDYERKYKNLFIMSGFAENECMTIARFRSGLRYEIKKEMSHCYLEILAML